jgi:diguanylate cyclase (GGDEF)-like protein
LKAVDGEFKLIYSDDDRYLSNSEVSIIGDYFDKNRSAFVSHRTEKSFGDYEQILSVFGESNVFSMVGIPIMDNDRVDAVFIGLLLMHRTVYSNKKVINQNNFVILKYVFGQFIDTIERLRAHEEIERMNKALEEMASTDLLTGLLNRQGFMTSIKNLDVQDGSENIVMYIDLDNFKYYNDTVGHEIGDLVLVLFANILQNLANDDGLAIRYGGDEFLLIFKDKNEDYAIDVAKSIYNQIEDGFASNIEKRLNKKIEIPEEKRLSCCIGISTFSSCEDAEIEKALDRADEALYSVKNTTKHNYKVWKDETRNEKN